jgi:hypothetical protein
MSSDRKTGWRAAAHGLGRFTAVVLAVVPALALCADISWKSTIDSGTMGGGKFTPVGTAAPSTGEKAELKLEGSDGPVDEKGHGTKSMR